MARPASKHPTDGELEVLRILWDRGEAELGQICDAIREHRQVATTTVATMLKVMKNKGFVNRTKGRRGFLWSAVLQRETTAREMVEKQIDHLFDGSAQLMVAHLLKGGKLSADEVTEIRKMLDNYQTNDTSSEEE